MRISVLLLLTTSQVSTYRSTRLLSSNQWDRDSVTQEMKDRLRLCGRDGRMHSPPRRSFKAQLVSHGSLKAQRVSHDSFKAQRSCRIVHRSISAPRLERRCWWRATP